MVINLPAAILVAMIRSQKLTNSLFLQLSRGEEPHKQHNVIMRCTMQNTYHLSAEIFPWPLLPMCSGARVHQEGSVVLIISSQTFVSLVWPRIQTLQWLGFTFCAQEKCPGSLFWTSWRSSIIPSLHLYWIMLVIIPRYSWWCMHDFHQCFYQSGPWLSSNCLHSRPILALFLICVHTIISSWLGLNFYEVQMSKG